MVRMDDIYMKKLSNSKDKLISEIVDAKCLYVKNIKHWVSDSEFKKLKAEFRYSNITPLMLVNVPKSKASKCRVCGSLIEKEELRIGYPLKDPRGDYGFISAWVHLTCSKSLMFSVLYTEVHEDVLRKYFIEEHKEISKEEGYNEYEWYVYHNLNWNEFFGGYDELTEEQKGSVLEFLKPYKLVDGIKSSIHMLEKEEENMLDENQEKEVRIIDKNFEIPKELKFELLEYQKEGVAWMLFQESSPMKGGILADEMGMGKTIQAITLILCQKKRRIEQERISEEEKKKTVSSVGRKRKTVKSILDIKNECESESDFEQKVKVKDEIKSVSTDVPSAKGSNTKRIKKESVSKPKKKAKIENRTSVEEVLKKEEVPLLKKEDIDVNNIISTYSNENSNMVKGQTLIVAPIAAVMQWKTEIEKFIEKDTLSVYVFHGKSQNISVEELAKHDIVITSYAMIEIRFRRIVNRHKIACEFCGRLYLPRTLIMHVKYFCGPNAVRTEKLRKTEKKNKETALIAMRKFDDTFVPTPSNVLKEILNESKLEQENNENEKVKEGKTQKNNSSEKKSKGKRKSKGKGKEKEVEEVEKSEEDDTTPEPVVYSPLSRNTSNQIVDLCNLGFDKEALENTIQELYKDSNSKQNWNVVIKRTLQKYLHKVDMKDECLDVLLQIYLGDNELSREDLKKLHMGELKVLLITMGKHVFGTKVELINRVMVSAKYTREEIRLFGFDTREVMKKEEKQKKEIKQEEFTEVIPVPSPSKKGVKISLRRKSTSSVISKEKGKGKGKRRRSSRFKSMEDTTEDDDSDESYKVEEETYEKRRHTVGGKTTRKNEIIEISSDDSDLDLKINKQNDVKRLKLKNNESVEVDDSVLHLIQWDRIILDEAHRIKNRNSSTTQSIVNLNCSGSRWCLTGTPLQNRIGELYSLIRFLEFYPYAYYFCSKKDCNCSLLNYEMRDNKYCYKCDHTKLSHFNYFNKRILKPIQSFGYHKEGKKSMQYLKEEILDKILLRRTKGEREKDVKLKPLIIKIRKDSFSTEEKDFYESLYKQTSTQFDTFVKKDTVLHNYAHIFDLLSRLRQAADHPYLILFGNAFLSDPSGKFIKRNSTIIPAMSTDYICGICLENVPRKNHVSSKCNHKFHRTCLRQYIESCEFDNANTNENEKANGSITIIKNPAVENSVLTIEDKNRIEEGRTKWNVVMNDEIEKNLNQQRNVLLLEDSDEEAPLLKSSTVDGVTTGILADKLNSKKMNDKNKIVDNEKEENIKKRSKSIVNVKFKDQKNSKFINLLSDKNLKDYPLGCPVCFIPLTVDFNQLFENEEEEEDDILVCKSEATYITKSFINRINTKEFQVSTKMRAIFEEVSNVIENTDDKCLIFSQFCPMLDLIEYHLKKNNIICSKLLGYMSMISRNNILYNFNNDKKLRVLLISLKAGGEGLNLQIANRIFIVDPWWNPASELQAIQRAHRIGQTKTVQAIRFIIEHTVEEKMIELQEKKQLVFDCTVGDSMSSIQKLTKDDLCFLFNG